VAVRKKGSAITRGGTGLKFAADTMVDRDTRKHRNALLRLKGCFWSGSMSPLGAQVESPAPEEFAEFDRVRAMTVLHGTQSSQGVAKILSQMHAGILVSEFEGMPVYVLELLAVGRPLVALELPQLDLVVEQNVSGVVVARTESADHNVSNMTAAFQNLKLSIAQSQFDPAAIRQKVEPFSHRVQKAKLLDIHRSIALGS